MAAAIPLAIGAGVGAIQGEEERKNTRRHNIGVAEGNKFSDVTGRFQQLKPQSGGALGGAIKGAVSFGGMPGLGGGAAAPTPQSDISKGFIQNKLGGAATAGGEVPQPIFSGGMGPQTGGQSGRFSALGFKGFA